jgi:transposase
MAEKFIVKLTAEERQTLTQLTTTGRTAAATLRHASVLLKADAAADDGWTDERIADAFGVSLSTIARVRKEFVEHGLEAALYRKKPTGRQYRKLDGSQEARLIGVACSTPPQGQARWTLTLLADKLVELAVVESISTECVRMTLKKTI